MNKLLTAAAVVATLGVALPAAAQSWGGDRYDRYDHNSRNDHNDARRIEWRIDRGARDGALTQREARELTRQLEDIRRVEWRAGRDGFVDRREAREIDDRYANLSARLNAELHDRDRSDRDYGYGYGYRR